MSRWSAADLARVSTNLQRTIAQPLAIAVTAPGLKDRRRKYGNEKVTLDGIVFDSKLEASRYQELKLVSAAGQIKQLEVHKKFYLHVLGVQLGYYESDFSYLECGELVVEDCKGIPTPIYKWKKRHLKAEYGIDIREIRHS